MAKNRQRSTLLLPWEHRSRWLQTSVSRSRVRLFTLALALLVAIVVIYAISIRHIRQRNSRVAIDEVQRAIASFRQEVHRCPTAAEELVRPPIPGRRYLQALPVDGWGNPLHVRCPGRFDKDQAEVISAGPSGSFLIDDNVR